ncbi:aminodeoxychorismate/anthranilate synthase component II [Sphingomonas sp. HDW15A]|uniref:anthranilate synthase component II n=1 Tax=Sphingomonas sp. HDW15A TaxID=2714942 RepID=UPI00140D45F3|nr:aminodeoxychorismate/anthranilate synthase component II [Sphingomonas sp. HDW15A]QIK95740.1 aminodeoxychorismate/anthranilate synthase component II [Sphingomonas sp. HDW15A]
MAAPRILVLDNYDSFTFTLVDYLASAGADVTVCRNDQLGVAEALAGAFQGVMISPGPGAPEDAGISVALTKACIETKLPLLGVCLGHQAIAIACGQTVGKVRPVHGKISRVSHDDSGLFAGLPSPMSVTRYHSLAITEVVQSRLIANAWTDDGVIMGVRHAEAPVHGVQFHPESVASEHGHALMRAFIATCS